ncbi:MAG: hypothetical protein AAFR52_12380 [Pseudomonadota bacterium]
MGTQIGLFAPLAGGLAAAVAVTLMFRAARGAASWTPSRRGRALLRFAWPLRVIAWTLVPLTALGLYAAAHAAPDRRLVVGGVTVLLATAATWLFREAVLRQVAWDERSLDVRTGLMPARRVGWDRLAESGMAWGTPFIEVEGVGRIWLSEMHEGADAFLEAALAARPDLFPGETSET